MGGRVCERNVVHLLSGVKNGTDIISIPFLTLFGAGTEEMHGDELWRNESFDEMSLRLLTRVYLLHGFGLDWIGILVF